MISNMKRVGVLSFANVGNFGDRLGMHLLSSILPSHAVVEKLYFHPWNARQDVNYDLLIIGIGNSLFAPLLNDNLIKLIESSKVSIGIFGTQYREEFENKQLLNVIDRLDFWFARYQEDIEIYAKSYTNVVHLGDWLIREFMSTMPTITDQKLVISDEVLKNPPLDRIITNIQSYSIVHSERLHPLLCALTSASVVSYTEQRGRGGDIVSGKFKSMLLDIFGKHYPENVQWQVDRLAVMNYRDKVMNNIEQLKNIIQAHLK